LAPGADMPFPAQPTKEVTIYAGGVHVSDEPIVIRTLLGSCVAVCLFDPLKRVGGMNHFMLPRGRSDESDASRFGVHAMDLLIGAMLKLGADRRRCVAKIFGGGHVIDAQESIIDVAGQNVAFARSFLATDGLPIVGQDVGGDRPRVVRFLPHTGQAFVKRLAGTAARNHVVREERKTEGVTPPDGDVILFD
jgi:chemotaxis receptor (MCP) glutamine deamidase CheD